MPTRRSHPDSRDWLAAQIHQAPTMSPLIARAHQSTAKQDASLAKKVSVKNNRDLLMSQCSFMRPAKSRGEEEPMLAYKYH